MKKSTILYTVLVMIQTNFGMETDSKKIHRSERTDQFICDLAKNFVEAKGYHTISQEFATSFLSVCREASLNQLNPENLQKTLLASSLVIYTKDRDRNDFFSRISMRKNIPFITDLLGKQIDLVYVSLKDEIPTLDITLSSLDQNYTRLLQKITFCYNCSYSVPKITQEALKTSDHICSYCGENFLEKFFEKTKHNDFFKKYTREKESLEKRIAEKKRLLEALLLFKKENSNELLSKEVEVLRSKDSKLHSDLCALSKKKLDLSLNGQKLSSEYQDLAEKYESAKQQQEKLKKELTEKQELLEKNNEQENSKQQILDADFSCNDIITICNAGKVHDPRGLTKISHKTALDYFEKHTNIAKKDPSQGNLLDLSIATTLLQYLNSCAARDSVQEEGYGCLIGLLLVSKIKAANRACEKGVDFLEDDLDLKEHTLKELESQKKNQNVYDQIENCTKDIESIEKSIADLREKIDKNQNHIHKISMSNQILKQVK